jgi:hypothetical protein
MSKIQYLFKTQNSVSINLTPLPPLLNEQIKPKISRNPPEGSVKDPDHSDMIRILLFALIRYVSCHHFDMDLDPIFHFDMDRDPDPYISKR